MKVSELRRVLDSWDHGGWSYNQVADALGVTLEPDERPLPAAIKMLYPGQTTANNYVIECVGGISIRVDAGEFEYSHRLLNALIDAYNSRESSLKWRKYPDEKPTEDADYLCSHAYGGCAIYLWDGPPAYGWVDVDYWMPIPETPE